MIDNPPTEQPRAETPGLYRTPRDIAFDRERKGTPSCDFAYPRLTRPKSATQANERSVQTKKRMIRQHPKTHCAGASISVQAILRDEQGTLAA